MVTSPALKVARKLNYFVTGGNNIKRSPRTSRNLFPQRCVALAHVEGCGVRAREGFIPCCAVKSKALTPPLNARCAVSERQKRSPLDEPH
ncbi:hypothetical protein FKM82_002945 [Ascaphus truei]